MRRFFKFCLTLAQLLRSFDNFIVADDRVVDLLKSDQKTGITPLGHVLAQDAFIFASRGLRHMFFTFSQLKLVLKTFDSFSICRLKERLPMLVNLHKPVDNLA